MNTYQFDKANELINKIEINASLDIIKDQFLNIKNSLFETKEILDKYILDIESIEKLLTENKLDNAKAEATAKLEEVKGIETLEKRLNVVIQNVNDIINNSKIEIVNHLGYQIDLEYKGVKLWNDTSFGVFNDLNGKTMLNFRVIRDFSPDEYMYDIEEKNLYKYSQGSIYLVNNNYEELYGYKDYSEQNKVTTDNIISSDEAKEIVINYYANKYAINDISNYFFSIIDDLYENEYFVEICGYIDDEKTHIGKPVANYKVNRVTGELIVMYD